MTQKPVVPLPPIPAQPPEIPFQKFKAAGDLDATVRVYERRDHCEGGTIFSARKSP